MSRATREQSIGLRVGDNVIHCNDEFTILDIRREETAEGMRLSIFCADPDQASKMQQENIKFTQTMEKGGDAISKIIKRFTEGGGFQ